MKPYYIYLLKQNATIKWLGGRKFRITWYYENGKVSWEQGWQNGKLHGKCIEWWENGKVRWERYYWKNKQVSKEKYGVERGKLKKYLKRK